MAMPTEGSLIRKKYLWALIVAVIVVVASSAVIYTTVLSKSRDISAAIVPSPVPVVPAGRSQVLNAEVSQGDDVVTGDADLQWFLTPSSLGSLGNVASPEVTFNAGDEVGSGLIRLEASYEGMTSIVETSITVIPPVLEAVTVLPSQKTLLIDEEFVFTATATNSIGASEENATIEWRTSGVEQDDCSFNTTMGRSVAFSAAVPANITLIVEAVMGDASVSGSASVQVVSSPISRSVDYQWYDMFTHPIGEWIIARNTLPWGEEVEHTDSYPYLYKPVLPPLEEQIWSFMRLGISGQGMSELNMNDNPVFLPLLSGEDGARGGNAVMHFYMSYLTEAEFSELLPGPYYEPWTVSCSGAITLDRQAAKAVLGLTDAQFEDFDTWWIANQSAVETAWRDWLESEGNDRLDIFNAYNYEFEMVIGINGEMVGEQVVLNIDSVGLGMEVLIARWMNEAWMPSEWFMEDVSLDMVIGPDVAEVDIDAAVACSLCARDPDTGGGPCWVWQPRMLDRIESGDDHPDSLFDPYCLSEYNCSASGSDRYGEMTEYDYTPAAWNLSEGETLTFEWPEGEQLFLLHDAEGTGDGAFENTTDLYAAMTIGRMEPMPSDAPDVVSIDLVLRRIVFEGPFDMWSWSHAQSSHEFLSDEWDRLGVLPYGVPYIEFSADMDARALLASGDESGLEEPRNLPSTGANDRMIDVSDIARAHDD